METLITVNGKSGASAQSQYSVRQLGRMAKALVGKQGKVFAVTINFDERTGSSRLIASYETEPGKQTFSSMAI
jgi:uncharacterized RmlC-like cupin family protein